MNTEERRKNVVKAISSSDSPISAATLAQKFNVSRQIIVGDVALLRAEGTDIVATPRGYILESMEGGGHPYIGTVAVKHDSDGTRREMYIVADHGGTVIDVTVEHSVYGQLSGHLNISSRIEVDEFCEKTAKENSKPLSDLTHGIHTHRIGCPNKDIFDRIRAALEKEGFLV